MIYSKNSTEIYLALGSNLGDRLENINKAIFLLNKKINISKISSIYETLPYGPVAQDNFYNLCLKAETNLKPKQLLSFCKKTEKKLKRKKTITWGPRTIDIDIIYYGEQNINTKKLIIPHKEILNRDFVYLPLLEINPNINHNKQRLSKLVDKSNQTNIVKNLGQLDQLK